MRSGITGTSSATRGFRTGRRSGARAADTPVPASHQQAGGHGGHDDGGPDQPDVRDQALIRAGPAVLMGESRDDVEGRERRYPWLYRDPAKFARLSPYDAD